MQPRNLSRVKLTASYRDILNDYVLKHATLVDETFYQSFLRENHFIFLGEIPNQPGHCVLLGKSGRMYDGFHTDDFEELSEDEV